LLVEDVVDLVVARARVGLEVLAEVALEEQVVLGDAGRAAERVERVAPPIEARRGRGERGEVRRLVAAEELRAEHEAPVAAVVDGDARVDLPREETVLRVEAAV